MAALSLDDQGCPSGLEPARRDADLYDPAPFVALDANGAGRLELLVRGARCGGCVAKIEQALNTLEGVDGARMNLSTAKLAVRFDPARLPARVIPETLARLGYASAPFDPAVSAKSEDAEGRALLRRLAVAGFASANVMLLSVSVWAGHEGEMGAGLRAAFHAISAAIALPAAAYAGTPFFASAWRALSRGQANMDVPISLGVILAVSLSVFETLNGGEHAYFDAAVMLLFFLLIGRWLDHVLRGKARSAARELLALQSPTAQRLDEVGRLHAIAARDVQPGDRLVLAPGDRAPVDVVIEQGRSEIDRSLATGESAPVLIAPGETMLAGAVNLTQRLIVRAQARVEDSFLAELARLIEAGEQAKSGYARLADRAARAYVPLVHTAAAVTLAGWLLAGAEWIEAARAAIALLIITCPCALGLAAPAVQVVATGRLFKRGVLVRTGDALERLAGVTHVVFDKTGTLTLGKPRLLDRGGLSPEAFDAVAALARASRHPLARAIVAEAGPGPIAETVEETSGEGVGGRVDGVEVRLGRDSFVGAAPQTHETDDGGLTTWARVGSAPAVALRFEDALRPDAAEAVAALKRRGLKSEMLTGDADAPARRAALSLGFEHWTSQARPADKAARLDALEAQGQRTLMVGDGLNDAPALARAHASISPGTAAEASQNAADLVFQGASLGAVVEAIDVARAARRRMVENFAFAALYNLCAMPLAASGQVTPLIAALAMSGSSLVVTLNALRLARGSARS